MDTSFSGHRQSIIGVVDYRGQPIFSRSDYGGWKSAVYILGVEIAERCAYCGISTNFITYMTGSLGLSTASAAASVNTWFGVSSMLPLLGGLLADSFFGRFRTIVLSSFVYILGLGLLTLTAAVPGLHPPCSRYQDCRASELQTGLFFLSIYLVAFAMGAYKPSVQAFGADQFDEDDPDECRDRSSFFNWWSFGMHGGLTLTFVFVNYVQQEIGWGVGFGIPCAAMVLGLLLFLLGIPRYRHYKRNMRNYDETREALLPEILLQSTKRDRQTLGEVLRLFPIWASSLIYAVVFSQAITFFTKQGSTMDRRIGPTFKLPPATLQGALSLSIVIFLAVYDRFLVPVARSLTGIPSGLTMLQRIGTGMLISVVSMVVAAIVEMKRLHTARDCGLIDKPDATVPMRLWWLVPQYVISGVSQGLTMVGHQEFFYDQVPDGLRSLGLALYLSIFGAGSFISSLLVSIIDRASRRNGGHSWFSDNLNRGHLDYFYWLLAGLSVLAFAVYLYFARGFRYKNKTNDMLQNDSDAT